MADIHHQALAIRTASQFNSPKYSDLTITCRGRTFHAHRNVLCPASKFFAAACDGIFQEAAKGLIDLPEDDPHAVNRMLTYMYASDYDDIDEPEGETALITDDSPMQPPEVRNSPTTEGGADQPSTTGMQHVLATPIAERSIQVEVDAINNNALVYALADKYDVFLLKDLAHAKFQVRAADEWATSDIASVLQTVYNTTPATDRGLRTIMLQVCLRYMDDLIVDESFRELSQADAALCFDVLSVVQKQDSQRSAYYDLITAREARLKRVTEWTKTQEQGFKQIVLSTANCNRCSRPLDLSVANGATSDWRGPFIVKCRHCRHKYVETTLDTA
ncbi:MAG: hypothetical protein Q9169_006930 [Polycauliona sp. 2 TL-2023]